MAMDLGIEISRERDRLNRLLEVIGRDEHVTRRGSGVEGLAFLVEQIKAAIDQIESEIGWPDTEAALGG
jgi:hypothetical protein